MNVVKKLTLVVVTLLCIAQLCNAVNKESVKAGKLTAQKKPVHVFITAGQSNTDGRVKNQFLPSYIKVMSNDTVGYLTGAYKYCKMAQNRSDGQFESYWPKGRITPGRWTYDAVTYCLLEDAIKEDFYVVKWAVGGTSISFPQVDTLKKAYYWSADAEWLKRNSSTIKKGRSLLLSFTESIDACIDQTLSKIENGYHIDAFLWHQGESDYLRGADYYSNLKAVVAYVRNHLSVKTGKDYSKLPFVFGTVPKRSRQYSADVEAGMKRLAAEDGNAYLIDMSTGELQGDRTHFNEKSAEYLGRQVFTRLSDILKLK